jgi:hypothetical protein
LVLIHRTDQIAGDMLADFFAIAVGINCPRSRIVPLGLWRHHIIRVRPT